MNYQEKLRLTQWLVAKGFLPRDHGNEAMKLAVTTPGDYIQRLANHLSVHPQHVWAAYLAAQKPGPAQVDQDEKTLKCEVAHPTKRAMSQEEAASAVVQTIKGRYEILRELGRGAMGVVYHARDKRLDREVAIKVIQSPSGQYSHDEVQELVDEAKVMAQFSHSNVVGVMDIGAEHGIPYIVMEFVKGQELGQACKEIFKDLEQGISHSQMGERVLPLMLHYIAGVAEIHSIGRVHRDLKPENGMVDHKGVVKVMDFGLAVRANIPASTAGGSPVWMSPEQVDQTQALGSEGEIPLVVSCSADVYTLGRMLFWSLTGGEFIHSGGGIAALFLDVMANPDGGDRARKRLLELGYDNALISIVSRCLAEKPEDRYTSAQELLEDLRNRERSIKAQERKRVIRKIGMFAGVLVMMAMAFGLWSLYQASLESDRAAQEALKANEALKREAQTAEALAEEQAASIAAANRRNVVSREIALAHSHQRHYRWEEAIQAFTRAVEVYPEEERMQHARTIGPVLMERAHCYFHLQDHKSIRDMEAAEQYLSEPLRSEAVFWSVIFKRVLPGGADVDYSGQLARITVDRLQRYVRVYLSDLADAQGALSTLDEIPVADRDWIWWFIRGLAYDSTGSTQRPLSVEAYTRAIELEPTFALSYYNRARLLVRLSSVQYQAASREPAGSMRRRMILSQLNVALSDLRRLRLLMPGWRVAELNFAEVLVTVVHFGEPENSMELIQEGLELTRSVWARGDEALGKDRFAAGLRMLQLLTVYHRLCQTSGESVDPVLQEIRQVWEKLNQQQLTDAEVQRVQQFKEAFELR